MIHFPKDISEALLAEGAFRAGGTDLGARRSRGVHRGDLVDLRDLPGLDSIEVGEAGLRVGARARVQALADDPRVRALYPGFAASAGGLATPAIRASATLGGALLQEVRCPYYRHPHLQCLKKGGASCLARLGDHTLHSIVDQGPCAAPNPATLALGMVAWDGVVELDDGRKLSAKQLYGEGRDPARTHQLPAGALVTALHLGHPVAGESSAWLRTSHRGNAEWPLVECLVRLALAADGSVSLVRIALGGVANTPFAASAAELSLIGQVASEANFAAAGEAALAGLPTLPGSAWRLPLVAACITDTLLVAHRALGKT